MKNKTARREIESLDYYLQNHTDDYSEESHTAMMMAIKALEQEPCDDAVSRQALLKETMARIEYLHDAEDIKAHVKECIETEPSVIPKREKGEWEVRYDMEYGTSRYKCLNCGEFEDTKSAFCPNCGAKMR